MDTNDDGRVSFEEFAAWWNSDTNNTLLAELRASIAARGPDIKGGGTAFG